MSLERGSDGKLGNCWTVASNVGDDFRITFYDRLKQLLVESEFERDLDSVLEANCEKIGYKCLAPTGYVEDIHRQRPTASRHDQDRPLVCFVCFDHYVSPPCYGTFSQTHDRLHSRVRRLTLELIQPEAQMHGLLECNRIGVEAEASSTSIVRREFGDDPRECIFKSYEADTGKNDPDGNARQRFAMRREHKKVSNEEWGCKTVSDVRTGRMTNGHRLGKREAKHSDSRTEVVPATGRYRHHFAHQITVAAMVQLVPIYLDEAAMDCVSEEVVAEKGDHGEESLKAMQQRKMRRSRGAVISNRIAKLGVLGKSNRPRVTVPSIATDASYLGRVGSDCAASESNISGLSCRTEIACWIWLHGTVRVQERYLAAVVALVLAASCTDWCWKIKWPRYPKYASALPCDACRKEPAMLSHYATFPGRRKNWITTPILQRH